MSVIGELRELDVEWSMEKNVSLLLKGLNDLKNLPASEIDELLEVLERKVLEIEEYYMRPVDSRDVYQGISDALENAGNGERAVEFHKRIAKMDSSLYEFKGALQNFFGNNKKAMEFYQKALTILPNNAMAQKGYLRAEKRFNKSRKVLDVVVKKTERTPNARNYVVLGKTLGDLGRMEEAFDAYESAVADDPENVEALARKGAALESMNMFKEAVEYFERALNINPKSLIARRGMNYADYYFKNPESEYYRD